MFSPLATVAAPTGDPICTSPALPRMDNILPPHPPFRAWCQSLGPPFLLFPFTWPPLLLLFYTQTLSLGLPGDEGWGRVYAGVQDSKGPDGRCHMEMGRENSKPQPQLQGLLVTSQGPLTGAL